MDFTLTDEQQMICDTAQTFLAEVSTGDAVRSAMQLPAGYDPELWRRICSELYWQAIHIPESYGGMQLGYVELVVMLEQMGRYLLCSPFYATVCLAGNALLVAGSEEQRQQYLSKICEGTTATLGYTGRSAARRGGQWGAEAVELEYSREAGGYRLQGELHYVPDGASAEILVVAARCADAPVGSTGDEACKQAISLFVLPADSASVFREKLPTMDQTRAQAIIRFDNVLVPATALMGEEAKAWPQLEKIINLACIAQAAEQLGGSQQVLDMAVAYSKERVQFNRPIAGFQAIKHMAADMMTRVEVARSGVYYAACVADNAVAAAAVEGDDFADSQQAAELTEAASIASAYCSDAYFKNAADALQIHGGVGFTWEYDVHLYFKRAKASEHYLGTAAWHRERLARLLLD